MFFLFTGLLQVQTTFANARTFNPEERSNVEHGSANLPAQQPRPIPNYPSFNSPPHPYPYLHWSPRIRNFNPGVSPNITVGAPAVPRMIASLPNQPNRFLNFPTTYQQMTTQVSSKFYLFYVHLVNKETRGSLSRTSPPPPQLLRFARLVAVFEEHWNIEIYVSFQSSTDVWNPKYLNLIG